MSAKRSRIRWRCAASICGTHGLQAFVDQPCQLLALALTASLELGERFVEQRQGLGIQRLWVGGIGHQYTGPGQHFEGIEHESGHGFSGGDQLRGALAIDLQRLAAAFFTQAQGTFDLAAREPLAKAFADRAFEIAQGLGQTQMRLQVAVVDRAQLPAQGALAAGALDAGKGGHAVHHGENLANFGMTERLSAARRRIVAQCGDGAQSRRAAHR